MNSAFTKKLFWLFVPVFILMNGCSGTNPPFTTPSASPSTPSASPTLSPSSTSAPVEITPTSTIAVTATSRISAQDKSTFVSENYPDNSVLKPGEKFVKTWEIKNTGSLTWTTAYQFILSAAPQGDTLGSPSQINFPQETAPGKTLSLSLPLVAPTTKGVYTVYWSIKNERGETVAVDGSNLWVKIQVCEPDQACSASTAGGGTTTTVSGVTATLTEFTNDAQSATVDFCMSVSLHTYTLDTAPSLLVDQKPVPFLSGSSDFASGPGCMEVMYQVSSSQIEQASHIALLIDSSLRMSPPPGDPDAACESAWLILMVQDPGLDFQCHFSMAGYYTNLQLPAGITQEQANTLIMDTIEGAIYGPWTLTIK